MGLRGLVLAYLRQVGGRHTAWAVAEKLGEDRKAVRTALNDLAKSGEILKFHTDRARYCAQAVLNAP